jgi:hypothetical protein
MVKILLLSFHTSGLPQILWRLVSNFKSSSISQILLANKYVLHKAECKIWQFQKHIYHLKICWVENPQKTSCSQIWKQNLLYGKILPPKNKILSDDVDFQFFSNTLFWGLLNPKLGGHSTHQCTIHLVHWCDFVVNEPQLSHHGSYPPWLPIL